MGLDVAVAVVEARLPDGGSFAYTHSRPFAAQRVHRGMVLSQRLLPRTHALQLFCREAAPWRSWRLLAVNENGSSIVFWW